MWDDFKAFVVRGNVIDLAVAFILGAAFTTIVKSLVDDIIMPPIGLLIGGVDFTNLFVVLREGIPPGPYAALTDAEAAGAVTINYGVFINAVISFLIVVVALFLIIRSVIRAKEEEEISETRDCPYCASTISLKAMRCPNCTSDLQEAPTVTA
jgi:large conductance mechanosensitive channel